MLTNYIKIAIRNIRRHKGYSFINITSLAAGLACAFLILLWVRHELSYDRFHAHGEDLYRVIKIWRKGETTHQATTPAPLAATLKEEFPEIRNATCIGGVNQIALQYGENSFRESGGIYADPAFLEIFSFPLIQGSSLTALADPTTILLTENLSKKFFHDDDPLGKTLRVNNQTDYVVRGVLKNIPQTSHLQFDFVLPFQALSKEVQADWHNTIYYTYVQLDKNTENKLLDQKILNCLVKHLPEENSSLYLQSLKDIHLHSSHLRYDVTNAGDILYIYVFSTMAVFILLIGCVTFMNLSTARSGNRTKEIGVRKVVGAGRAHLIIQFLTESLVLSCFALLIAIALIELLLPAFNTVTGTALTFGLDNTFILAALMIITVITAVIAGSYPALFLSSFNPVSVIRGRSASGVQGLRLRRVLVVCQFFMMSILIFCSIVMYKQLESLQGRNLGFEKEHLVSIPLSPTTRQNYSALKNELLKNPSIVNVAGSASLLSWGVDIGTEDVGWQGKSPEQEILMRGIGVDHDFIGTFRIQVAEGRDFDRQFASDTLNYILNETAVRTMGLTDPIGKQFRLWRNTGTIIGVVKDYHFKPLYSQIEPLVLRLYAPTWLNYLYVKIQPGDMNGAISFIKGAWKKVSPNDPVEFRYADDVLNNMYGRDRQVGYVIAGFALVSISLAAMGLFGLAAFIAEQRTKEIGIRKVLGASVPEIAFLLIKEFTLWVIIALLIAFPVAYLMASRLLQIYAYRIPIDVSIYLLTGAIALCITLLAVLYQTLRAASTNPARSLQHE